MWIRPPSPVGFNIPHLLGFKYGREMINLWFRIVEYAEFFFSLIREGLVGLVKMKLRKLGLDSCLC